MALDSEGFDFAFRAGEIPVREAPPIDFTWLRDFFGEAAGRFSSGEPWLPGSLDSTLGDLEAAGTSGSSHAEFESAAIGDAGASSSPGGYGSHWGGPPETGPAASDAAPIAGLIGSSEEDGPVDPVGPYTIAGYIGDGSGGDPVGPFPPAGYDGDSDSDNGDTGGSDPGHTLIAGSLQNWGDLLA